MIVEQLALIALTALANGLVTYGVIKTTLAWHRKDIDRAQQSADHAHARIDGLIKGG